MSEEKPLTGVKKRQQIEDTRKQVFLWAALASAVVVTCLSIGNNLIKRISYQQKVNGELSKAAKTLQTDVNNIDKLIGEVNALKTNQLLNQGNLKSEDSTVLQVVIDALPTEDDTIALKTSLQDKILQADGARIDQISIDDSKSGLATGSSSSSSTQGFPQANTTVFKVSVIGTYDTTKKVLEQLERTIRPIIINKMTIEGSDSRMTLSFEAQTYYSPSVNFELGSKEVKYEKK